MKISVGQFSPTADVFENLETLDKLARQAASEKADMIVFPEESMLSLVQAGDDFADLVEKGWERFARQVGLIAASHGIAVVVGGYEPNANGKPYNTLLAVDAHGAELETYRKIHLYDAFTFKESNRISAGDPSQVATFKYGNLTFGMMTCYDVRFPELARNLALAGADVLLVPAAWYKGENKIDHWQTLLKARAVENTVWVVAAGTASNQTIGYSVILDPLAQPVAYLEDEPYGLVTGKVGRKKLKNVREYLPVLENRCLGVDAPKA